MALAPSPARLMRRTAIVGGIACAISAGAASASQALWDLQAATQGCQQTGTVLACRQAQAQVTALKQNRAYPQASHLCKEEIGELNQVLALVTIKDAVATDVMSSVADVQQACQPFGF